MSRAPTVVSEPLLRGGGFMLDLHIEMCRSDHMMIDEIGFACMFEVLISNQSRGAGCLGSTQISLGD